nr:uncharacterized protein LOC127326305 [Lolium perenne]
MGQKAQQNPSTPFSRSAVSLSRFVPEEPKPLSPPTPPHPLPVPLQRRRLSQGWSRTGTKLLCPVAGASSEWLMVPLMDECGKTRKEEIDIDAMAAASDSPILDVILSNGAKASMPVLCIDGDVCNEESLRKLKRYATFLEHATFVDLFAPVRNH